VTRACLLEYPHHPYPGANVIRAGSAESHRAFRRLRQGDPVRRARRRLDGTAHRRPRDLDAAPPPRGDSRGPRAVAIALPLAPVVPHRPLRPTRRRRGRGQRAPRDAARVGSASEERSSGPSDRGPEAACCRRGDREFAPEFGISALHCFPPANGGTLLLLQLQEAAPLPPPAARAGAPPPRPPSLARTHLFPASPLAAPRSPPVPDLVREASAATARGAMDPRSVRA
jgi:hypothetical protein